MVFAIRVLPFRRSFRYKLRHLLNHTSTPLWGFPSNPNANDKPNIALRRLNQDDRKAYSMDERPSGNNKWCACYSFFSVTFVQYNLYGAEFVTKNGRDYGRFTALSP